MLKKFILKLIYNKLLNMTIKIIFIILLFLTYVLPAQKLPRPWFAYQIFCARISFKCNGEPANNVRIVTYDYTAGIYSKVGTRYLDESGYFSFCGVIDGYFPFNPYLYVYHKCNISKPNCEKEIYLHIPRDYVFWGVEVSKYYDIKNFELNKTHSGEKILCN
ncbi:Transthyretin-like family-containing protein [Strongyloides ratti]|uniref:Transthyretin-like family-containing protein n=1 Tax=Strongyloides ratti TaxID=34506 RepID=A0A090LNV5_STRRB|nr:Transthyretin-like family-containing protein [Strongyloides ratti]CEF69869.2 Transthyretin-like family-containing protein [Strongyloides ratti]